MEENKANKAYFQELMVRRITSDVLNTEENNHLNAWLEADVRHKQEYNDLLSVKNVFSAPVSTAPDTNLAWQKVSERIAVQPVLKLKTSRSFTWLKYAAAIVILSAVSLFFFYPAPKTKAGNELLTKIIKPGSHHARLILSDGRHIPLAEKQSLDISAENTLVASNKGSMLVYKPNTGQQGYHTLIVPEGGQYEIVLPDKTHVWVNSGSQLTYRVDFNNAAIREVKLAGEAYFNVAKDKIHPFIVKTDHMGVEAVGTAFNVSAYKNAAYTETTLVEGIVNVSDRLGNKQQILAGSKIRIANKNNTLTAPQKTVPVYNDYAWKEGLFVFDNMPLEQIGERISRWYNVKVVFTNNDAKQLRFTGSIEKDTNLNMVVKLISTATNVNFKLNNGTLYVTKPSNN